MLKSIFSTAVILVCIQLFADVTLPAIFSEHAVLQRSKATAVYGKADPDEKVTAVYGSAVGETVADKNGRFIITLDLSQADNNAKKLIVTGKNRIEIDDVIVGDIWFCIGQSNMAMTVNRTMNAREIIDNSANNNIRMFSMPLRTSLTPKDDAEGKWLIASPKNTGLFTAVGYYFARKINQETNTAIGLLNPSWGGSHIEAWFCKEHLENNSDDVKASAYKELDNYINYETYREQYIKKLKAWEKSLNWVDDHKSTAPPADAKWEKAPPLTAAFNGAGVVWFRKTIEVTPQDIMPNGKIQIYFRKIMVETDIFWEGRKVLNISRHRSLENWPIRFNITAKPGKYTMMMRVSATEKMFNFAGASSFGKQNNAVGWEFCREKDFPAGDPKIIAARPSFMATRPYANHIPNQIYNSLVHPIIRYTAKGALWYQGESNASGKSHLYGKHIKTLVNCLRTSSNNHKFRFYAVQLPDFQQKKSDPNDTGFWPIIRENQTNALKTLPFTAEIVINDTGEALDIHPICKQPVGERLAAVALHRDYGKKDVICGSPEAVKATSNGNEVIVEFTNCHGGLVARKLPDTYWLIRSQNKTAPLKLYTPDSQVQGFALCGKDGKWHWANARIDGNNVIVSSPQVPHPEKVRYAYQNNPTCNLASGLGWPVGQFSLDI